MPKKKSIPNDEPLVSRPQRNTRVRKVFDPSDNYLPRKRNKPTPKSEKPTETIKKNKHEKKKVQDTESENNPINESLDCSTIKISSSPEHSSPISPVQPNSPELNQENSYVCYVCSESLIIHDLVDCPICLIKAHKHCILVEEPIWKFKLDKCVWLCRQCRKKNCSNCLQDDSLADISRRCVTCKVGLHLECYEKYDIKPLHTLQIDMYVCIPCMTLAIQKIPEEEEEDEVERVDALLKVKEEAKVKNKRITIKIKEEEAQKSDEKNVVEEDAITVDSSSESITNISDKKDDDLKSSKSYDSFLDLDRDHDLTPRIPDVSNWTKYQVYEYLTDRLPKEILTKIIKNDIDGHALQLLKRTDITLGMGLKLGPALKFYKEVRILQTQSTYHGVFWE